MTTVLDGRAIARRMQALLKDRLSKLQQRPGLAIVQVGKDAGSTLYVRLKERAAAALGIAFEKRLLPPDASSDSVIGTITSLNARPDIHGIVVQLPLPRHLDSTKILSAVSPEKDVDGLGAPFQALVRSGKRTAWLPALLESILALLHDARADVKGKTVLLS